MNHGSQCEIQGTQTQNGKDVRGINDERVLGNSKNGGYGIHRKNNISHVDQHQSHKQRGRKPDQLVTAFRVRTFDPEFIPFDLGRQVHVLAHPVQQRVFVHVGCTFVSEQHFDAGKE